MTASLHIEHPVTDLETWKQAFSTLGAIRRAAGVTAEQVRRPVDDAAYVVVDLEFGTVEQATAFLAFLRTEVWAVPERAPALAGSPDASVLATVALP